MTTEDIERKQFELEQQKVALEASRVNTEQQERYFDHQETSMIKEQLDLGDELERIDYLLRGYTLEEGRWVKPNDNRMVVFSDYGVHLIRNTIAWYLNKNTLLSNYDEQTILDKMFDFSNDLADTIFMEYEKVFQYPSTEECIKLLEQRIEKRAELTQYAMKLVGNIVDIETIKETKIKEIDTRIEEELEKIKQQVIKEKLKRFLLIMRTVQDAIHSTYLRALHGTERSSLRRHMSVTETKGMGSPQPQQKGGIFPWSRKR